MLSYKFGIDCCKQLQSRFVVELKRRTGRNSTPKFLDCLYRRSWYAMIRTNIGLRARIFILLSREEDPI